MHPENRKYSDLGENWVSRNRLCEDEVVEQLAS